MLNTGGTATTGHLTPRGSARAGRRAAPPPEGGGGSNTNSPSTLSNPQSWNNKQPQQEQLHREDSFLSTESESFNISQGSFSLSQNPATSGKLEEETRPAEPPSAATLAEQEPDQTLSASSKRESGGVRDRQNTTTPQSPSAASFSKSPAPSWLGDDEGEGDDDDESFALDSEMGDSHNQQGTPTRAAQSGSRPNPVAESDNASFYIIDSPSVSLSQNPSMILTNSSSQQSNLATAGTPTTTAVAAAGSTPSGDADQRHEDLPIPLVQETNECTEGNKETPEKEDAAAAAAAEDDATPAIVLHRSSIQPNRSGGSRRRIKQRGTSSAPRQVGEDDTDNQETADTDDGGSSSRSSSSSSDAEEDLQKDEGPLRGDLSPSPSSGPHNSSGASVSALEAAGDGTPALSHAEQVTCKPTPPSPRSKKSSGRGGAPPNLAQLQLEETGEDGHKEKSPRAARSKRIDHHLQCHSPTAGNRIGGGLSPRGLGMSPKAMAFGSMRQAAALDGGRISPRASPSNSPRSSPSRHRPREEDARPAFSPKSSVQRSASSPCFTHSGRSVFGKAESQILFSPASSTTTDVLVPQLTGLTQDQSAMMLQMFLVGGASAFLAAASPRRGCGSHINHKGAVMGASGRSRGSNTMSASDASSLGLHDDTPLSPVGVGVAQVGQDLDVASPLAGSQSRRRASSVLSLSTSDNFAPLLDVLTQMKQEKRFKLEAECLSAAYKADNVEDGETRKRREEEEAIAARELLLQQQALRDWKPRGANHENWPQRVKDLKFDLRRIHLARQGAKIERAEKLKRRVLHQEGSAQWDSLLRHQESQLAAVHRRHETVTVVSARKSESRYWRDQYFEQNPHLASASRRQRSNSPTMLSSSGLQYWDRGEENEISRILSLPRTPDRQRMPKSQSPSGEGKKRKQSPIPSNEESVRGFGPKQMSDTMQPPPSTTGSAPHRQNYSPSQQQRQDQRRKFAAATAANHKPPFNTPNKVQARSLKPATIIPHCPPFGYPIKPKGMKQFDLSSRTSLIHQQNALSEASARKKQQKEQEAAEERYRERKRPSSARTGKGVKYTSPLVQPPTAAFSTSKKCGGLTKRQEMPVKTLLIKAKNEEGSDDQQSLEKGDSAGPLIPQHSLDSMSEQDKQLLFLMTVTRRIQEGTYDADRHRGGEGSPCPDQQPSSSPAAARANVATTSRSPGDELRASCAGAGASAVRGRGSSLKKNSTKKRQQATVVTPLV